jgi:inner membrane protein
MEFFIGLVVLVAMVLIAAALALSLVIFRTEAPVAWVLRAVARYLSHRHPRVAEKLGLGSEVHEAEHLNDRSGRLVGRISVVEQPIVAGRGRLTLDGTTWSVQGPDMPAGTRVKITEAQGTILIVDAT